MRTPWVSIAVCVQLLLSATSVAGQESTEAKSALKDIKANWRRQQVEVKSARLGLDCRQTISAGNVPMPVGGLQGPIGDQGNVPDEVSSTFQEEIIFSGEQGWSRIESSRAVFNVSTKQFVPTKRITGFDGQEDGSRDFRQRIGKGLPLGRILAASTRNDALGLAGYAPILLAFRSFSPAFIGRSTLEKYSPESPRPKDRDGNVWRLASETPMGKCEIDVAKSEGNPLVRVWMGGPAGEPLAIIDNIRIERITLSGRHGRGPAPTTNGAR